jgi:ornithine cyclodeaminase/alanine dehydrogenase-like protein (mu-crystallin family)
MLILNAEEIRQALPMRETIDAMKLAYAALSDRRADVPLRTRLSMPAHEAVSLIMPAYVSTEKGESLAIKVVSLYPKNPARGLAFIQAAVMVFEADTGRPIALLEGSMLTAIRTGAASGAAADILARRDASTVTIFGAGVQGRTQMEAVCSVRKIEMAYVFDRNPEKSKVFAQQMSGQGPIPADLRVATDARQAVQEADIICAATTSSTPVFADHDLKPGVHICAVGSYTPEMQEVPSETIQRAKVVVDSRSATLAEAGDLIQPLRQGLIQEGHVYAELGELLLGRKPGRQSETEITYFKSVGIAAQDAMAAQLAFQNAQKLGLGHSVNF